VAASGAIIHAPRRETMKRNWPLLSLFSAVYAFLILAPSVFHQNFPLKSGIELGDALDIVTPFAVFGLVWLLVRRTVGEVRGAAALVLLLIAVIWSQGQGMHLASNSIGHQFSESEGGAAFDLVHFYDEVLSHYVWWVAILALPVYLLVLMFRDRTLSSGGSPLAALPAAAVFGSIMGVDALESAVVPMALPAFAAIAGLATYLFGSAPRLRGVELFAFTGASAVIALGVLLGWGVYYGGWPEPSDVGLI